MYWVNQLNWAPLADHHCWSVDNSCVWSTRAPKALVYIVVPSLNCFFALQLRTVFISNEYSTFISNLYQIFESDGKITMVPTFLCRKCKVILLGWEIVLALVQHFTSLNYVVDKPDGRYFLPEKNHMTACLKFGDIRVKFPEGISPRNNVFWFMKK